MNLIVYFESVDYQDSFSLMNILFFWTTQISIMPLLVAVFRIRKLTVIQKLLAIAVLWGTLIQEVANYLGEIFNNNLAINHLYHFFDFLLLSMLFMYALRGRWNKYLIPVISSLVLGFSIVNSLFIQSLNTFDSYSATLGSTVLIFYSVSYFYLLLKGNLTEDLGSSPMFWAAAGILIYHSGSLVIQFSGNYLLPKSQEIQTIIWGIHAVFNIIRYLIYAIALWVQPKKSPYSIS